MNNVGLRLRVAALPTVLSVLAFPFALGRAPSAGSLPSPLLPCADPGRRGATTFVDCTGIGKVAVSISEPAEPRYAEGAPVVVAVSGFFTPSVGYVFELDPDVLGAVCVTMLWPGVRDARTGVASEGTFDYGGEVCLSALRDVIRFATGEIPDAAGRSLQEIVSIPVLVDVVGLYAFSHSGIAATNVLCLYGEALQRVRFFVGRENPTIDPLYPLEGTGTTMAARSTTRSTILWRRPRPRSRSTTRPSIGLGKTDGPYSARQMAETSSARPSARRCGARPTGPRHSFRRSSTMAR